MDQQKRVGRPRTTEDTPLTDKQLLFCEYYLETLNQSESYRRVAPHVADTTARVEASKLMKKPNIRKDHGIWSHHFMENRWGNNGNSG